MCGRVVSSQPRDLIADYFGATTVAAPELPERYNVAPAARLYSITDTPAGRVLDVMRWGLVFGWNKDPNKGPRPTNARAETVMEKPMFARALRRRRGLLPVAAFYEWTKRPDGKQPYLLRPSDGYPLAMATLWESWRGAGDEEPLLSFAVVTTAANADMAPIHNRMPVLIGRSDWERWLNPDEQDPEELAGLLVPAPTGTLVAAEVGRDVNDARNEGPELLAALA